MSKANIGWLFYKEMYKQGNDETHIKNTMSRLLNVNAVDESLQAKERFTLKTTYPGLLIGSGYTHGLKNNYDAKIGFYFDYTTGLPLIQGSSVKGMLRSYFGLPFKNQDDPFMKQKHALIRELLYKSDDFDVEALGREIFEGIDSQSNTPKSIYQRDIFYEARVVATETFLLRDDYLAPHGDNALKTPDPLRFIKVAPEVTFEFGFDLKDSTLATAEEKKALFKKLIEIFGIGAKTNVGYGQFEVILTEEEKMEMERKKQEKIAKEKAEKEQREKEAREKAEAKREEEEKERQEEKAKKAEEGISALLQCKSLAEGFKLLKDAFGPKPNPTEEQKEIIRKFYKKQKNLSKGDEKVFKKYGI
ncbi:type III-B CRISPR module RAMP protein Cmr6 [Sulfurovum sp.]|jgi:CRISPR-associated protein Cmr6|uniref:type III-B CRISPR module RAMP protein Cmr6 n=1 Tax=Sulfurovum sp. TaxID=1969726 RepID=UPI002A359128|nr:type III-B CRISPR module RAMP protein Cmr6 [Sulfurovum sp.]MDY0403681.1 type III-B CRISPR module RAMP protein Cmr6 [Sulfurovum sp.]